MGRREYQSGQPTTLLNPFNIGNTTSFTITLSDPTLLAGWPNGAEGFPFWVTIDAGKPQEERVLCSSRSGSVVTVAASGRGADGTTQSNHAAGAEVWPSWSATDADEANAHVNATANVHGVTGSIAPLESPTFTGTVVLPSTTSIGTVSSTEIGYLDGVTSAIQTQFNALDVFPKGMIAPFAGASAPTGWLLCDGSAVSRTTYSALWDVLRNGTSSSPYGNGNGTTTFNLPDLLGRVPMGAGTGTDLTTRTLGAELGVESVTLTAAQSGSPSHDHGVTSVGGGAHTASGSASVSVADHAHSLIMDFSGTASHDHAISGATNPLPAMESDGAGGSIGNYNGTAVNGGGGHTANGSSSVSVADHSHTIDITVSTATAAAEAHTNIQPSTVVNFIIKH